MRAHSWALRGAHDEQPVPAPDGAVAQDRREPLRAGDRACYCPATAVVRVVMPASAQRAHRTDLLLCGHHYRISHPSLAAAGAAVYDASGARLPAEV